MVSNAFNNSAKLICIQKSKDLAEIIVKSWKQKQHEIIVVDWVHIAGLSLLLIDISKSTGEVYEHTT